jgi:hypothetical protein
MIANREELRLALLDVEEGKIDEGVEDQIESAVRHQDEMVRLLRQIALNLALQRLYTTEVRFDIQDIQQRLDSLEEKPK